jgi:hypothetical protein
MDGHIVNENGIDVTPLVTPSYQFRVYELFDYDFFTFET